ncbi:hypothetical protein CAPTEDRAFT_214307 [Capitella teleta]|uniref:CARD domain-containing protein n=1 Tax=Capitella teleta TaxID=283909 RepID=R7VBZ1_CAPTE|nr:hypothetical protein CAPTEDRAFT_214307 [Capitella teleta]|eukprot:ELU16144.1 hypothetical protein CAPTEDRAFT_214307 [Capitella teleta]
MQELKVEHILASLIQKGVLSEEERNKICTGKSTTEKTRHFLDVLVRKGRDVNWYGSFREALKEPVTHNSEVKKKYRMLIEFLDNTILPDANKMRMNPYNALPGIHKIHSLEISEKNLSDSKVRFSLPENEEGNRRGETKPKDSKQMLIKGYYAKWVLAPENYATLIDEPEELFALLENANEESLLQQEKQTLQQIRRFELIYALSKRKKLPEGVELCMNSAVEEILCDQNASHLYVKYFHMLKEKHNLDLLAELVDSFYTTMTSVVLYSDRDGAERAGRVGLALSEFLLDVSCFDLANQTMRCLVEGLAKHDVLSTQLLQWKALVKLFEMHNMNLDFLEAEAAHKAATIVGEKIKQHPFGASLLEESSLFCALSSSFREQGKTSSAYSWALAALKNVGSDCKSLVIETLCCASEAFCLHFEVPQAEDLVLQAVSRARDEFSTYSPQYVKALLCYCHYSNEYRQDAQGVETARTAVEISDLLFNASHMLRALAHQALARALVVTQQFTDDEYFDHCLKAWHIAMEVLPGDHPRLASFQFTLAQCLQWRSSLSNDKAKEKHLLWAETEAEAAVATFSGKWGSLSPKTIAAKHLLAQIYTKMDKLPAALALIQENINTSQKSLTIHVMQKHLIKATLGNFYCSSEQPRDAIPILCEVIEGVDCRGTYLSWVHLSYDSLISSLKSMDESERANIYQNKLMDWMMRNPKPSAAITWYQLHSSPVPYSEWLKNFMKRK